MIKTLSYIWGHPLSSRRRAVAFSCYFRWQVGSRILRQPIEMPFIGDTVLMVEPGMTGATGNIYCGLHEFVDMAFVLHFLRPNDLFVDVGANIGSYSILAAGVAGAEVMAFEPVPATFEKLRRNIRANALDERIIAAQCAVGGSSGTLAFTADLDTMNRVVGEEYHGRTVAVPVAPLDALLRDRHPTMWKVDVEGFEPAVLTGATSSQRDPALQAVLLEGDQPEVVDSMLANGFVRASYKPFERTLSREPSERAGNNSLWLRETAFEAVQARCRQAPAFTALTLEI